MFYLLSDQYNYDSIIFYYKANITVCILSLYNSNSSTCILTVSFKHLFILKYILLLHAFLQLVLSECSYPLLKTDKDQCV